ncbi:hypothetical protein [Streptomyces sp. 135]|uniref:hypothetical protein n=1 Tax=Streptomyces sp. 135 TaxID=2838850 RepID=UPI001CBFD105|nr:hypothetical protein [Streptomyces sp. 135]
MWCGWWTTTNSASTPTPQPSCLVGSPTTGEILSRSEVYRAVVESRYRTLEHLRQIRADGVLASHEPGSTEGGG